MLAAALASAFHILGASIGLSAVFLRGRALRDVVVAAGTAGNDDGGALARVFRCDNAWGVSALLIWGSGLARAFGGLEKGTAFYLHNGAFFVKMGLLAVVMLLELWPMVTLVRWRLREKKSQRLEASDALFRRRAGQFSALSLLQAALLLALLFTAPFMARGALMFAEGRPPTTAPKTCHFCKYSADSAHEAAVSA